MGVLLSKDDDITQSPLPIGEPCNSSGKRKRGPQTTDSSQKSRKKRAKVARKSTRDENQSSEVTHSPTGPGGETPDFPLTTSDRVNNSSAVVVVQEEDDLRIMSDVMTETASYSSPMERQLGLKGAKGNLPVETDSPLAAPPQLLPQTPTNSVKAKRERKSVISPYFNNPKPQLSSPPSTPTPSNLDKAFDKRSKISVVESYDTPPSLHHFHPTSSNEFGLIQEKLRHEPWKMLVAVVFLNVTTAKMALPLLAQLFERWPTPEALSQGMSSLRLANEANFDELSTFLYPIGLYNTRAKRLIEFSTMWLSDPPRKDVLTRRKGLAKYPPTAISHLPGVCKIIMI